jgi:hypothetical protein
MRPHHQRVIDRIREMFAEDPNYLAILLGGSIAKGWDREDSDVDILLVATPDEFARHQALDYYTYSSAEMCDYPGGYVDGKIIDLPFLREVAGHGSEPARSAFVGAQIIHSRLPELEDLLRQIVTYPETDRVEKMRSFYAEILAWQWYVGEAEKRSDPYLLTQAAANLVLFGGRLILAHNRLLYPFHKWFMTALREAPEKPSDLMALSEEFLKTPTKANADRYCSTLFDFTDWDVPTEGWPTRFLKDVEWSWRRGNAPIADW